MVVKVSIDCARRRLTGNRAAAVLEDDSGARSDIAVLFTEAALVAYVASDGTRQFG